METTYFSHFAAMGCYHLNLSRLLVARKSCSIKEHSGVIKCIYIHIDIGTFLLGISISLENGLGINLTVEAVRV